MNVDRFLALIQQARLEIGRDLPVKFQDLGTGRIYDMDVDEKTSVGVAVDCGDVNDVEIEKVSVSDAANAITVFITSDNPGLDNEFSALWNHFASLANQNSVDHGFWDGVQNDGEKLCLMHSEISEALEALRMDEPRSKKIPEFLLVEEELADLVIRVMDFSSQRGYNIADAVHAKMAYNKSRPPKHGKKF